MENTAKARYDNLALRREPFLKRGRECAKLTIPSLLPPAGFTYTMELPQPAQGLGARAVVYLSSKMMTAFLPPGQNFFRFDVPLEAMVEAQTLEVPPEIQKNLALAEAMATSEIERRNWRNPTNLTLQLLTVTGNACEYLAPDNTLKVYRLDQFVVSRDLSGNLLELILLDTVHPDTLPEDHRVPSTSTGPTSPTHNVELFTWCKRRPDGRWEIVRELAGTRLGKPKVVETLPFLVYRYAQIPGEEYGRSKVDEHYPDLLALDTLTQSMLDLSGMNARNVVLVRPNATGQRLKKFLKEARNGDVGIGNAEDVQLVSFENVAGANIVSAEIERITQSLAAAFLLGSGLRRDAERVTATELRMIAEEIEGSLGGVYSLLSEDMQRGRLVRLIANLEATGKLPQISDTVEPVIIVGLEALSRERDAVRVQQVLGAMQGLPPTVLEDYVKWEDLLKTLFIGAGLPATVRTDAEAQQNRNNREQQAAAAAGPQQQPTLPTAQ